MSAPPRPQAVTSACLFLGVACLILFLNATAWLSSWNSIETQETLRKVFTPTLLDDTGITFDTAVRWTRRLILAVVVVLISGVVFAVYTALGHRASRVWVTVVAAFAAVVFFLSGGWFGIIPAMFLAFICVRLWSPEANDWFAVKNGREPRARTAVAAPVVTTYAPQQPPQTQRPQAQHPQAYVHSPPPRHPQHTLAVVIMICSSLVALGSAAFLLVYAFARDDLVRQQLDPEFNWAEMTEAEIRQGYDTLAVLSGAGLVLGLVALVVSIVMLRRQRVR